MNNNGMLPVIEETRNTAMQRRGDKWKPFSEY